MGPVYLDHNATTPMRREVRELLAAELDALGGNPSSVHAAGRRARAVVDGARERVAAALGVGEEECVFTSGGTEANNLALFGALRLQAPPALLVAGATEHSSVLEPARRLELEGFALRLVAPDSLGRIEAPALLAAAAEPTCRLVSVMAANNEVGSAAPVAELGAGLRALPGDRRPLLHTDATQALGRLPVDLASWGVDLASFSAHKIGGPLGVGLLVRRRGTPLAPMIMGGAQEGGLRAGTENAPALAAAALAVELAVREQPAFRTRVGAVAAKLWALLAEAIPGTRLLGPPIDAPDRLPNTLAVLLPDARPRMLVARLDLEGVAASAGSACASGSIEPSHVLLAMGCSPEQARGALRLSLGRETSPQDARHAVETLRRTWRGLAAARDDREN
ncbi:MAG: cysteine desulfurase family protein [Planctomycetota bacterium]|jgi:cysteine desulfurase|nr:cysteine desulfurase family protein [Planctomycetota bacterium]MDP6762698.1 cysteine desulfurase family protein [Planctomycetota bacterium]MDP6988950.1 cysteine desulfurase family protein [Planctomycetota bacterium]